MLKNQERWAFVAVGLRVCPACASLLQVKIGREIRSLVPCHWDSLDGCGWLRSLFRRNQGSLVRGSHRGCQRRWSMAANWKTISNSEVAEAVACHLCLELSLKLNMSRLPKGRFRERWKLLCLRDVSPNRVRIVLREKTPDVSEDFDYSVSNSGSVGSHINARPCPNLPFRWWKNYFDKRRKSTKVRVESSVMQVCRWPPGRQSRGARAEKTSIPTLHYL